MRDALEQGRWQWQVGWVVVVMVMMSMVQARRVAHEGREGREGRAVGQEQAGLVAQVRALVSVLVLERAQVLLETEAQEGEVLLAVELGLAVMVALQVPGREREQAVWRPLVQALESALGWVPGQAPELVSGLVRGQVTERALELGSELVLESELVLARAPV